MRLEELRVYALSMDMGEKVWNIVVGWNYFWKKEKPSSDHRMTTE